MTTPSYFARFNGELLGERLLHAIGKRPLRSLAPIIGVSIATLSRVSRGAIPSVPDLVKIINWLDTDLNEFIIEPVGEAIGEVFHA